jgi:hypothetical protein
VLKLHKLPTPQRKGIQDLKFAVNFSVATSQRINRVSSVKKWAIHVAQSFQNLNIKRFKMECLHRVWHVPKLPEIWNETTLISILSIFSFGLGND